MLGGLILKWHRGIHGMEMPLSLALPVGLASSAVRECVLDLSALTVYGPTSALCMPYMANVGVIFIKQD